MTNNYQQILLHLSLIKGVGPVAIATLFKMLVWRQTGNICDDIESVVVSADLLDIDQLYQFGVADYTALGLSTKCARLIVDGLSNRKILDEEMKLVEQHQVRLCTWFDADYPVLLRHITVPPPILYCQGGVFNQRRMIAIVGSRKANEYGQRVVNYCVPFLKDYGWTIVSGGALGIDTMAHKAAQADGRTVVILGSGLLSMYPPSNRALFDCIVDLGGVIVSPFSMETAPERWNFPIRNRVIAGMSEGCIVVQAAEKSGALITAQYALESGREVFAVPGPIVDPLSAGCHSLLKQGATLVHSVDDILSTFHMIEQQGIIQETIVQSINNEDSMQDPLYSALSESSTVDELCDKMACDVIEIQSRLFELQLEGKVEQDISGHWRRV